jgi:hypothetical protein
MDEHGVVYVVQRTNIGVNVYSDGVNFFEIHDLQLVFISLAEMCICYTNVFGTGITTWGLQNVISSLPLNVYLLQDSFHTTFVDSYSDILHGIAIFMTASVV